MTASGDTTLNQYAQHLFNILQFLRIYRGEKSFSFSKRIMSGILTVLCLIPLFLLTLSEVVGFKDAEDYMRLARRIGAASFHVTGIVKWCYCMWKIDNITSLINMLHHCHYLTQRICQNDQGIYFYTEKPI